MKFHPQFQPLVPAALTRRGICHQHGVVLFVVLIALVVMALAAVALIRSVDTGTLIAGNLSARQSATTSADSGMESAMAWIAANEAALVNDNAAAGYYATSAADAKALTDASTTKATGVDIDANGMDTSGNTVTYVIQRMCRNAGLADDLNECLRGPPRELGNSQGSRTGGEGGAVTVTVRSVMYRITIRSAGPRNTVSYTQAFVY